MSGKHSSAGDHATPAHATETPETPEALRDEVAHLREAMRSQRDIGMAIGLLSARFACSTDQAWRTILRVSQDSNTKVRTVAHVLVTTHDGTDHDEQRDLLESLLSHLPPSGWPAGPRTEDDRAP